MSTDPIHKTHLFRSSWPRASLVAQVVKNLPVTQETQVQSLGQEDPLEKEMATHSSILAWRIPMDRGAWWETDHGVAKNIQDQVTSTYTPTQQKKMKRKTFY